MKKKIYFTGLTLLVSFLTFAQTAQKQQKVTQPVRKLENEFPTTAIQAKTEQFVVNSCKSNVRDFRSATVTQTTISTNGVSTITISEKGDYTFFLTPKNDTLSKPAKVSPIIRTTLCKNPPCPTKDLIFATPNDKGEVEYKNLEVGTYKITYIFTETDAKTKTTDKAN